MRLDWVEKVDWRNSPLPAANKLTMVELNDLKSSVNALYDLLDNSGVTYVNALTDLPDPVENVITLNKAYKLSGELDLMGNRFVIESGALLGVTADVTRITSTGLTGNPLITFTGNGILQNLTIENVEKGFLINAPSGAFDWTRVNFENCDESGEVGDCLFFIIDTMAFINSSQLRFSGTLISFVASPNCIWRSLAADRLESQIIFESTFVSTGRVRIQDSQISTLAGQTGIEFVSGATVPDESFILRFVRFSTVGTPLLGINGDENTCDFSGCQGVGVLNSRPNAYITMNNNATATVIAQQDTAVKAAGTTIQRDPTQRFTGTNNRITYNGVGTNPFKAVAVLSVISGNNNQIGCYFYKYTAATNSGALILHSEVYGTTSGSGRAEAIKIQTIVSMSTGDYLEVWVENKNNLVNITVDSLSVIID